MRHRFKLMLLVAAALILTLATISAVVVSSAAGENDAVVVEEGTNDSYMEVDVDYVEALSRDKQDAWESQEIKLPPPAPAPDCSVWASQEEAQQWQDEWAWLHDTSNIDTDGDGAPCTLHFAPAPEPVTTGSGSGSSGDGGSVQTVAPGVSAGGSVWDSLAQCEAGGNWNTNTGNGYSGGLQFAPGTWDSYGGGAYAGSAGNATREQQIEIAQKVQSDVGWGAWPGCTSQMGLR